jgi:hypothetical protein
MNNQTTRQSTCSTSLLCGLLSFLAMLGSVFGLIAIIWMPEVSQGIVWNVVASILWLNLILSKDT